MHRRRKEKEASWALWGPRLRTQWPGASSRRVQEQDQGQDQDKEQEEEQDQGKDQEHDQDQGPRQDPPRSKCKEKTLPCLNQTGEGSSLHLNLGCSPVRCVLTRTPLYGVGGARRPTMPGLQ